MNVVLAQALSLHRLHHVDVGAFASTTIDTPLLRSLGIPALTSAVFHADDDPVKHRHLQCFVEWWQRYRSNDLDAGIVAFDAALDFLIVQGAHRDAFYGAALLIRAGILERRPRDAADHGSNWIHYLARFGNEELLHEPLADMHAIGLRERFEHLQGTRLALDEPDEFGKTPLIGAVMAGNLAAVNALIALKVDVEASDEQGARALHYAAQGQYNEVIKALLSVPAVVDARDDRQRGPLHWAARENRVAAIRSLIEGGARINLVDSLGDEPLHEAALYGQTDAAQALLDAGAKVGARNRVGETPLHLGSSHPSLIKLLMQCGAKVDEPSFNAIRPLHLAVQKGSLAGTHALLALGANPNARDLDGQTALHKAIYPGVRSPAFIDLLQKNGARIDVIDQQGNAPLHIAVISHSVPAVRWLIERGADVDVKKPRGCSALHLAIMRCYAALVEALLQSGADISLETPDGRRPIDLARQSQDAAMLALFMPSE